MDKQITIALIGVIGGILTLFVKSFLDRRAAKKDLNKRDKNTSDRLGAIENLATQIDIKLGTHLADDIFRNNLKNIIRMKISERVHHARLNWIHRNILFCFGSFVEEYSLLFYYSDFRDTSSYTKANLDTYLKDSFEVKRAEFNKYVRNSLPERKAVSREIKAKNNYTNKNHFNTIDFYDLLMLSNTLSLSLVLVERLIRNGFEGEEGKKELISLFSDYIDKFITTYQDTLQLWETLPKLDESDV